MTASTQPIVVECHPAPVGLGGFQYMLVVAAAAAVASVVAPERAAAFNHLALIVESLVAALVVVVGLVDTAVAGRLLKDRWHDVWAPVAVATSVAMTAPVADGRSAGQMLLEHLLAMTA